MGDKVSPGTSRSRGRTAIIGAGIIGLSCAFELAIRRGRTVTLFDERPPGQGASWAAAGMLAPAFEAPASPDSHPALLELCLRSASLWPEFAGDIGKAAGLDAGLSATPALAVALDASEAEHLTGLEQALSARAVPVRRCGPEILRQLEPAISGAVLFGLELATDTRIDNRRAVTALIAALRACPRVEFAGRSAPLRLRDGHLTVEGHEAVVVAAGWQSGQATADTPAGRAPLATLLPELESIEPVGGQMISVAGAPGLPRRVVRSGDVYIVPRSGAVIIGATVEPGRILTAPDPARCDALHRAAAEICPAIAAAPVTGCWSGIRPGTPDHAPLVGAASLPGVLIATGHYRNGILLAPLTARIIADQLSGALPDRDAGAFSPRRFLAATT